MFPPIPIPTELMVKPSRRFNWSFWVLPGISGKQCSYPHTLRWFISRYLKLLPWWMCRIIFITTEFGKSYHVFLVLFLFMMTMLYWEETPSDDKSTCVASCSATFYIFLLQNNQLGYSIPLKKYPHKWFFSFYRYTKWGWINLCWFWLIYIFFFLA